MRTSERSSLTVIVVADHLTINGGAGRVAVESALGLAAAGHTVEAVAGVGPVDPRLAAAGVEVHVADGSSDARGSLTQAGRAIWNTEAGRLVASVLAAHRGPNTIVHLHAWGQVLSPAAAQAIRRSRLPAVMTLHDYLSVCPNGNYFDFRRDAICTRRPLSAACVVADCDRRSYAHKAMRLARTWAARHKAAIFDACPDIVVLSDLQRRFVDEHAPENVRLHQIGNPIDCVDLGPSSGADGPFLFVGRFTAEKGATLFARAAVEADVAAMFIGEGPEADAIRAANGEARLVGWQDAAGIRRSMRSAAALVFPSTRYEGQPLTVLEALSLGLPVIVSDACAGREAVADGISGLWFRSQDQSDLARKLAQLSGDRELRTLMGIAAHRSFWERPLTLERHVAELEGLYRKVLVEQAHGE